MTDAERERDAFRAGWLDYHLGVSNPRNPFYNWGQQSREWQDGWQRAVEEQDSRHIEQHDGVYVYVQMPRHPLVADLTPANSSGWSNWAR